MVVGASGCQPFNACFTALAARARYGVLIAPEEWNNSPTTSLAIAKQLSPSLFVWDKQRQPEQIHVLLPWLVKYQPDKEDPEDYAHRHAEHHAPSESIRFVAVKRPHYQPPHPCSLAFLMYAKMRFRVDERHSRPFRRSKTSIPSLMAHFPK